TNPAGASRLTVVDDQVLTSEPAYQPVPTQVPVVEPVTVPAHLVPPARFAATNHQQTTGRHITAEELSARISVPTAMAGELLALFDINPPATTAARVNGFPTPGGGGR